MDQSSQLALGRKWTRLYSEGLEFDSWGQLEEAQQTYTKLANMMRNEVAQEFTVEQKSVMKKLILCLNLRAKVLEESKIKDSIGLEEMKELVATFEVIFKQEVETYRFPLDLAGLQGGMLGDLLNQLTLEGPTEMKTFDEQADEQNALQPKHSSGDPRANSLLPPTPFSEGATNLSVLVEKIGLKDATSYIDPRIAVSVHDGMGVRLEPAQEGPVSNSKSAQHIQFGFTAHVQTPIHLMPEGSVVIFEMRHFKPKKRKISSRCWAFMELDEMQKPGPVVLELYKKPTDPKRKKLHLHSVKDLYLHVQVNIRKD